MEEGEEEEEEEEADMKLLPPKKRFIFERLRQDAKTRKTEKMASSSNINEQMRPFIVGEMETDVCISGEDFKAINLISSGQYGVNNVLQQSSAILFLDLYNSTLLVGLTNANLVTLKICSSW